MEWQPIETAPRDGGKVLLLTNEGECVGYFKNWWFPYEIEGFTVNGSVSVNATHWTPLPTPPQGETE